jgi:hypothetical protein
MPVADEADDGTPVSVSALVAHHDVGRETDPPRV